LLTVKVNTLIIDDNWQSLDNEGQGQGERGMTEFEANKRGFPNGLKGTVDTIKQENPGITHIAVWHTMVIPFPAYSFIVRSLIYYQLGYWGAISPDGDISKKYKTIQATNPTGRKWTVIAAEDIDRFYNDFYT
jgi:hypothetical protein